MLEVTAPESGILSKILKENGAIVTAVNCLASLKQIAQGQQASQSVQEQFMIYRRKTVDTQFIRHAVKSIGTALDFTKIPSIPLKVTGTGKSGRLTKTDVLSHLNKQPPAKVESGNRGI